METCSRIYSGSFCVRSGIYSAKAVLLAEIIVCSDPPVVTMTLAFRSGGINDLVDCAVIQTVMSLASRLTETLSVCMRLQNISGELSLIDNQIGSFLKCVPVVILPFAPDFTHYRRYAVVRLF